MALDCIGKDYNQLQLNVMFYYFLAAFSGAHSQSSSSSMVYYGYTRYTGFSDASVALGTGAGTSLSTRFRFCRVGGVLLEAVGTGGEYFSVGVTSDGQLLVEFSTEQGGGQAVQVHSYAWTVLQCCQPLFQ